MTQRAIDGAYYYFVTTNVTYRHWWLDNPEQAEKLAREIHTACKEFGFTLFAFCILPNHMHMLVYKAGNQPLSRLMKAIKGRFSRQQHPGRFWQPRFNFRIIFDDDRFARTLEYVRYNYRKMDLDEHYGQPPFVFMNWPVIHAFFS